MPDRAYAMTASATAIRWAIIIGRRRDRVAPHTQKHVLGGMQYMYCVGILFTVGIPTAVRGVLCPYVCASGEPTNFTHAIPERGKRPTAEWAQRAAGSQLMTSQSLLMVSPPALGPMIRTERTHHHLCLSLRVSLPLLAGVSVQSLRQAGGRDRNRSSGWRRRTSPRQTAPRRSSIFCSRCCKDSVQMYPLQRCASGISARCATRRTPKSRRSYVALWRPLYA